MAIIRNEGRLTFDHFDRDTFSAARADDVMIKETIQSVYSDYGYICDPHTACGFADLPATGTRIVLGTAHPAKFPDVIEAATGVAVTEPSLEALKARPVIRHELSRQPEAIRQFIEEQLASKRADEEGGSE